MTKIVYILLHEVDYYGDEIVGVYATYEAAEVDRDKRGNPYKYKIEEYQVYS